MNTSKFAAVVLVVLGAVVLVYSGVSFRTRGKPIDIGSLHVETTRRHYIPPAAGALALAGGIAWLMAGNKKD